MGFLRIFGGNGDNSQNDGVVYNIELVNFMREAFGREIRRIKRFDMPQYSIEFLLIDNDLLVTNGLSAYTMANGTRETNFELTIRVPFEWDQDDSSSRHTWFVTIMQSIITQAISGLKPIKKGYLKVFDAPFHYASDLNSVTLYNIAEKRLQNGTLVDFMMVVPLFESELDDDYYIQDSSDLKGLAWQQASLFRGTNILTHSTTIIPITIPTLRRCRIISLYAIRRSLVGMLIPMPLAVGCRLV